MCYAKYNNDIVPMTPPEIGCSFFSENKLIAAGAGWQPQGIMYFKEQKLRGERLWG